MPSPQQPEPDPGLFDGEDDIVIENRFEKKATAVPLGDAVPIASPSVALSKKAEVPLPTDNEAPLQSSALLREKDGELVLELNLTGPVSVSTAPEAPSTIENSGPETHKISDDYKIDLSPASVLSLLSDPAEKGVTTTANLRESDSGELVLDLSITRPVHVHASEDTQPFEVRTPAKAPIGQKAEMILSEPFPTPTELAQEPIQEAVPAKQETEKPLAEPSAEAEEEILEWVPAKVAPKPSRQPSEDRRVSFRQEPPAKSDPIEPSPVLPESQPEEVPTRPHQRISLESPEIPRPEDPTTQAVKASPAEKANLSERDLELTAKFRPSDFEQTPDQPEERERRSLLLPVILSATALWALSLLGGWLWKQGKATPGDGAETSAGVAQLAEGQPAVVPASSEPLPSIPSLSTDSATIPPLAGSDISPTLPPIVKEEATPIEISQPIRRDLPRKSTPPPAAHPSALKTSGELTETEARQALAFFLSHPPSEAQATDAFASMDEAQFEAGDLALADRARGMYLLVGPTTLKTIPPTSVLARSGISPLMVTPSSLAMVTRSPDNLLTIDWPLLHQTSTAGLAHFILAPEVGKEGIFRVNLAPSSTPGSSTFLVRISQPLSDPKEGVLFKGESDSSFATAVNAKLKQGEGTTATVVLAWAGEKEGPLRLVLRELLCWEFLGIGVPLETPLDASGMEAVLPPGEMAQL